MTGLVCLFAAITDYLLAEPRKAHPLVGFGQLAALFETALNRNIFHYSYIKRTAGMFAVIILVGPLVGLAWLIIESIEYHWLLDILLLYLIIGNKSLIQHARRVYDALQVNDTNSARLRVSYMVSRNTDDLNEKDISKATVESVLENGNDAVFAAIFWYLVAGIPGAIAYRLVNTLDAMWGYKTPRHLYFGWFAAKLDDIFNFIPARLTAITYALMGKFSIGISCWQHQAHHCDSPNAGPVMTAGAGALGIKLGGPAMYHGKVKFRPEMGAGEQAVRQDILRAIALLQRSVLFWLLVIVLFNFILFLW